MSNTNTKIWFLLLAAGAFARRNLSLRHSPQLQPALEILDHLRRRFALFKLCAHLL